MTSKNRKAIIRGWRREAKKLPTLWAMIRAITGRRREGASPGYQYKCGTA
jgi:hypothetical protein